MKLPLTVFGDWIQSAELRVGMIEGASTARRDFVSCGVVSEKAVHSMSALKDVAPPGYFYSGMTHYLTEILIDPGMVIQSTLCGELYCLGAEASWTASDRQSDGELLLNRSSSLFKRTDCDS